MSDTLPPPSGDRDVNADTLPHVVAVNIATVREVQWRGRRIRTAIWKVPVGARSVRVATLGLEGDQHADLRVHGGPDKAVYAYTVEDYAYWREVEGLETEPGLFGENLTIRGIDLRAAEIGERWRVGTSVLEVSQPRLPCRTLGIRLRDPRFPRRFLAAARFGAYLRVIEPGELQAGDQIRLLERPGHGVTLALVAASRRDATLRPLVRRAPRLPDGWWS